MQSDKPTTVKFKFGQPWTHRGVTYKAGDEADLSADDVRMLTQDKANEPAKTLAKDSK
jgi:hypothetical protein